MIKKTLIGCLLLFFYIFGYSQTGKITDSDFSHYTDCQRYDNWKTDKGDTLKIRKSFLFDNQGNVIRKLEGVFEKEPKSKDLTVYQYDNQRLLNEILYQRTDMENVFQTKQLLYFYNKNGLIDSQVVINSYPNLEYKLIDRKEDSISGMKNIREFDDPIWIQLSEYVDTSSSAHGIITKWYEGKEMVLTGYKKVKKKVSFHGEAIDTLTSCKYYYNANGQKIKEFFDSGYWNMFGRTIIDYDKNERLFTVLCYFKNSYKFKYHAAIDSTNLWIKAFFTDSLPREEAIKQVAKQMKEQMSDTLLKYNSYVTYNKDGSVTETAVYSNEIYKLTSYRNKKGQMMKTINSHTYVKNKYKNGRFIPTDIKTIGFSDFLFYETTSIYEYDSLGRIVKCIEEYLDNNNGERKENRKSENFTIYKYNNNLPLKLPESEYVDGYSNNHNYYSIKRQRIRQKKQLPLITLSFV
ncbi:MAG TPA: hypothetical protein VLB84_15705 [Bacteroidia bacterium]|nr:hypothetical protein [Bacteroidia bacterium]